jgi:hypothetical protein
MATFSNNFGAKTNNMSNNEYICIECDYKCSKRFNWDRHISTSKHFKSTSVNKLSTKKEQKELKGAEYMCENCGKEYNDRSGLWRHKKKCNTNEQIVENNNNTNQTSEIQELKEFMKYLVKENTEMKTMIFEVIKNGTHNTNNSHNKTFNLQFFLNETCKDAMNIMDFVDSIKLQLSDLENVGKVGYVEGISNIIVKNLKELDVTQRPVHCADKKREVMYVKDDDKWEKEDDTKKKIRKAIKRVAFKNQRLIPEFKKEHPDCNTYHSKFSDQYNKIIVESMGGSGDNDLEKEDKIIRNISKTITIDKEV